MTNIFKIKKYSIVTFCMVLFSLTSFAQDCPAIIGSIKTIPSTNSGICQANVIATPTIQSITSGQATNISLNTSVIGTTFSWTVIQVGVTGATTGSGNTIKQTLTNLDADDGKVTYVVTPKIGNCTGISINVTINIESYKNIVQSGSFTRNNCGTGGTGSTVTYTVDANTYTSTISQADADSKVVTAVNAGGQAYANTNGICTYSYSSTQSGSFNRNNCGANGTGSAVTYSATATSTISQADADSKAIAAVNAGGQAYANTNGSCTYSYSSTKSGLFTRNNCGSGKAGSTVTYSATATSTISQADADSKAMAAVNAGGQAYANANGSCIYNTSSFGYQGQWRNDDTIHRPEVNCWVKYIDGSGVTRKTIIGGLENGCQQIIAVSILSTNGVRACTL